MSRTHTVNIEFENIVMDYVRTNPSCTISEIVGSTGLSYMTAHRLLHGRNDIPAAIGLVAKGKLQAVPNTYNGKLCWLYSLQR